MSDLMKFYYEQQINRDLKRTHISGCRCNERLKAKTDGSKRLAYTGLRGDLSDCCSGQIVVFAELLVFFFSCF